MPPAHVMVCKGPPLHRSRVRNGMGDSGHPPGTADRAISASKVALAFCSRAAGHSSHPPSTISLPASNAYGTHQWCSRECGGLSSGRCCLAPAQEVFPVSSCC